MPDSNITKKALAASLKELMEEKPFEKISVGDICEKCQMNRKSFYYHFKDKYDLVNWIFDSGFFRFSSKSSEQSAWEFVGELCGFLYADKDFYRKAFAIKGQNSFSEHFRDFVLPVIAEYLKPVFPDSEIQQFHLNFFSDAFICAIERWLADKDPVSPSEFIELLKSCVTAAAFDALKNLT